MMDTAPSPVPPTDRGPLRGRLTANAIHIYRPPTWGLQIMIWCLTLAIQAGAYHATTAWGERPLYRITGDEPHYLTIATSLLKDHDLDILNNYRDKDYLPYYEWHLGDPRDPEDMHALYGPDGALHSKHSLGLPLMILPAMWFGGFTLAIGQMLVVSALLGVQLWLLAREVTQSSGVAFVTWLLAVTTSPLLFYADQFYPEVAGALLMTLALRTLMHRRTAPSGSHSVVGATMRLAIAVAGLPWLHLRYIPLATVIAIWGVVWWWRTQPSRHETLGALLLVAVAGITLLLLDWRLFGGLPAVNDYGSVSLSNVPTGIVGLLLDRQYGLLSYAPIWLLAIYGVITMPRVTGWLHAGPPLTLLATYYLFIASFSFWFGAFSPPSRMLVPIMPIFVVAMAVALHRWRGFATTGLTVVLALGAWGMAGLLIAVPRARYNYWDGNSVLLAWLSNVWAVDVTKALPTFVVADRPSWTWALYAAVASTVIWWGISRRPIVSESP